MKKIKYSINEIKILRSDVREHNILFEDDFSLKEIDDTLFYDISINNDYCYCFVHIHYDIKRDIKNPIRVLHFDLLFTFHIKNLNSIISNEEHKKFLFLNLIGISYSSSRGIIFSETKGFKINNFYLKPKSPIEIYNTLE